MKKIILILSIAVVATIFLIFSKQNDERKKLTETKESNLVISIGKENYKKLSAYIKENGSDFNEMGFSGYLYKFFDKEGNEHQLLTGMLDKSIRTDTTEQITCDAYCMGMHDMDHYFNYSITDNGILISKVKNFEVVKEGYKEFLSEVNKNKQ